MLSSLQAKTGYKTTTRETATSKDIELKIFSSVTSQLSNIDPEEPGGFTKLAEVLHENVQLWTTIMADVAGDGNQLPLELRAQIFNLGEFIRRHTLRVLEGADTVDAIVDINRAIIAGLRESSRTKEAA